MGDSAVLSRRFRTGLTYLLLFAGAVIFLFPFYHMIVGSFKSNSEINTAELSLLPKQWLVSNYEELFHRIPFHQNLLNSLAVAVTFTALSLFLCSLAGYVFAKHEFPGRDALFIVLVSTMMIPAQVGYVPLFIIMNRLGWLDTFYPLIIPHAANAFGIFLMRQYAQAIPDELLDAARIDGCSKFRLYWAIALPLLRPGLIVVGLIFFTTSWNDFQWPLIVLSTRERYTAPVALNSIVGQFVVPFGVILAGVTVSALPLIALFLVFQRFFVRGLLAGALRG